MSHDVLRSCRVVMAAAAVAAAGAGAGGCVVAAHPSGKIFCDAAGGGGDCPADLVCSPANLCVARGSDVQPPSLLSARFDPVATSGAPVSLVVTASEALGDAPPPTLTFSVGADPGFALVSTEGAAQTLIAAIGDEIPEGTFALARIDVVDVAGNPAAFLPANASFTVDRTAPTVFNAVYVDAPGDGIYADPSTDDAGNGVVRSVVTVHALANEATRDQVLAIAGAAASCTAGDDDTITCAAQVSAATPDGVVTPVLGARDLAGNAAPDVVLPPIRIDTRPPNVVAGSATVVIRAGPLVVDDVADGGDVTLTLIADEDVVAAAAFVDAGGVRLAFDAVAAEGRRFTFHLPPVAVEPGTYAVKATLTDLVGHVQTVVVDVVGHADGLRFVGSAVCPKPDDAPRCLDLDGDGHFSTVDCSDGDDEDDLDPSVFFGAPAIPGDGKDNAETGAPDEPIDEATGVFIDAARTADAASADGSRAHPYASFTAAAADGVPTSVPLFLAVRGAPVQGNWDNRSIIGGFDADAGWVRTGAARTVVAQGSVGANDPVFVVGVVTPDFSVQTTSRSVLIDCAIDELFVKTDAVITRSTLGVVKVFLDSAEISDSELRVLRVFDDGQVLLLRSIVREGAVLGDSNLTNGTLVAVSSVFQGSAGFALDVDPITVSKPTIASLYNSTFVADPGIAAITLHDTPVVLDMIGNVVVGPQTGAMVLLDDGAAAPKRIVGNAFVGAGAAFAHGAVEVSVDDIGALPNLRDAGDADTNVVLADAGFDTLYHLGAGSLARGDAEAPFDLFAFDDDPTAPLPTSAVLDLDLQCRYGDGAADFGADEF